MNKFLVGVALLGFMAASCAGLMMTGEEKYGKSVPVITEVFASKQLKPAETWKVYLKASDLDGDMRYITAVVYQPAGGDYPISRTKIRRENGKELDGYIYLNTWRAGGFEFENFFTYWLTVQIQDKAGHHSEPVQFSVTFNTRAVQELPPPGVFKEQNLGPILVILHPPGGFL